MNFLNEWECEFCCKNQHCGKCNCCKNYMNELAKKREELYTVLAECVMLSHETGLPEKQTWILHSAPCRLEMARSIAQSVRMVNKSYRIVTKDWKKGSVVIDEWLRPGFCPDDKQLTERK